jgi:hypothetical protein
MFSHPDRDRRQVGDLVPPRLHRVDQLPLGKEMHAELATLGPMLDDLVDLLKRQQPPMPSLMPGLAARRPT